MRLITTKELRSLHIATRHHHTINSRLAIVRYAEAYGFKGAARRFGLDRKTVRTWHRRWVARGPAGLVPRHPLTRRRRLSEETVRLIEPARRDLQFGAMRTRIWLDRGSRAHERAALYMAALVATRKNPVIREFNQHMCQAGKAKKLALTACMRKLLTILNAMVKNRTPWRVAVTQPA